VTAPGAPAPARSRLIPVLVATVATVVCLASPQRNLSDARFTLVVSQSLLETGRLSLDGFVIPPPGRWARFMLTSGRLYYVYPPANAILATPAVALGRILGLPRVVSARRYDQEAEMLLQALLAGILVGGYSGVAFATSRLLLPARASLLVTAGAVLGTTVWSTASRVLWTHTWSVFLLGWVVWMVVRTETGRGPIRPLWLGTLLAWAFLLRPTNVTVVVAVVAYLFWCRRAALLPCLAAGAVWGGVHATLTHVTLGVWLPPYPLAYSATHWLSADLGRRLAGVLVSPSRGLLVYVPVLLPVLWWLVRFWPRVPHRRLVALAAAVIAPYIALVSTWYWWYGGFSYGPRLLTDIVPWLGLLGMLGTRALLDARPAGSRARRLHLTAAGVLLALSVAIHARGAWSPAGEAWNMVPVSVDVRPDRVWDWRHPQFLAGLQAWSCQEEEPR
jgi:hypothetical protein